MKQMREERGFHAAGFEGEGRGQEPRNARNAALGSVKGKEMESLLEPIKGM